MILRDVIIQAGIALEEDYAQMKLMDLENGRLRKRVFEKEKQRNPNKQSSGRARHMTAAENLDLLARQDWESRMKDVFKEASPRFKVLKKNILDHQKAIEKAKTLAEREAKKAAKAVERAARARGQTRGRGRGRGQGRRGAQGRGTRGAHQAAAEDGSDPGLESTETDNSLETSSTSSSESETDIPIPRSRRQRPVRVIRGQVRQQDYS